MSLEDTIKRNDQLRCEFWRGELTMTPDVLDLPAWFRGRAIYRMTLPQKYMNEDHSEGVFVFGGFCFYWHIRERTTTLSMAHESDVGVLKLGAAERRLQCSTHRALPISGG